MAAIGVALWKYVMRYSPENPNFFNRDRFVLSNGEFSLPSTISWGVQGTDADYDIRVPRPLLLVAVHIHAPGRLQEHDA